MNKLKNTYTPLPLNTDEETIPSDILPLIESIARNVHEVWATQRISQGWRFGPNRDDNLKLHPSLVPYDDLTEDEKAFDRNTAIETLKFILKSGFKIIK